jgi:hypothetical protein
MIGKAKSPHLEERLGYCSPSSIVQNPQIAYRLQPYGNFHPFVGIAYNNVEQGSWRPDTGDAAMKEFRAARQLSRLTSTIENTGSADSPSY